MALHIADDELNDAIDADAKGDLLERDIHFYHFVLAREVRNIVSDLAASPPKHYSWEEWEFYLCLMGDDSNDEDDHRYDHENKHRESKTQKRIVPENLQSPHSVTTFAPKGHKQEFSWLSDNSPLMDYKSETSWILERLSITLERELHEMRRAQRSASDKSPAKQRRKPPISLADLMRTGQLKRHKQTEAKSESRKDV